MGWLDTCQLWNYGKKLEEKHPDFCFLGVYASDLFGYADRHPEFFLCNQKPKISKRLNECKKMGFILNTDPISKSGDHWIAIYGEKESPVYLIDSGKGQKLNSHTHASFN